MLFSLVNELMFLLLLFCSFLYLAKSKNGISFSPVSQWSPTFWMGLKPLNLFLPSMNKTESLISESQGYLITIGRTVVIISPTHPGWEPSFCFVVCILQFYRNRKPKLGTFKENKDTFILSWLFCRVMFSCRVNISTLLIKLSLCDKALS